MLQSELEKWGSAISCIGRQPYEDMEYGSLDEGGAINALYVKKLLADNAEKSADPETATELIERAVGYIKETENIFEDSDFEDKRNDLVHQLKTLQSEIEKSGAYTPIQKMLSQIVSDIKPIESAYSARIYDCSREIQKKQGSNAAWAAVSMLTLGFVKKPKD